MSRECRVVRLGLCGYREAYLLQKQLLQNRIAKKIPDTLILLQHPPVFTIGRKGTRNNIVAGSDVLCREGIAVYETDRGGDITYHGPGQLVGYPILDLKQHGGDVILAIKMYEEVIIRLLEKYGYNACRIPEYPGVWVGGEKICAIGIGVSNWVTYHGFALNINTNLKHFSYIIPCGINGRGVTSLAGLAGGEVDESAVAGDLIEVFGNVFDLEMKDSGVETSLSD